MKIKTGINFAAMLALFAFGPKENRDFIFRTPPERLYGEVEVFSASGESWFVARNVSDENVDLLADHVRIMSSDLQDGSFYVSNGIDKTIYKDSLALVVRASGSPTQQIKIGDSHPRIPGSLYIATEAETFYGFLWPLIVVLLFVVLTYMINDFSWQCGSPIRDTIKSED